MLLDTDIGTNIDDAVCLAFLLAHPAVELAGVSVVTARAQERAALASALCAAAGVDVPVLPGAQRPLPGGRVQDRLNYTPADIDAPFQHAFRPGEAVEFMRSAIRGYPAETVLVSTGPLTNIALLFTADEEIPRLLAGMVSMCGSFDGRAETNVRLDPVAAAAVFEREPPFHRVMGLDVTEGLRMPVDAFIARLRDAGGALAEVLVQMARAWADRTGAGSIVPHDLAAAVVAVDAEVCSDWVHARVEVEAASGRVCIVETGDSHCRAVARRLDGEKVWNLFWAALEKSM